LSNFGSYDKDPNWDSHSQDDDYSNDAKQGHFATLAHPHCVPGMTNGPLGNFTMPKQTITQGTNKINFTADMFFNASADGGFRYMEWTLGLTMGDYVQHVTMIAEPTVKAFGFLTIKTKLEKHMVCNCLEPTPGCVAHKTPDNSSRLSREVPKFGDDGVMTVYMFCEPAGVPAWSGRPNVTLSLPSLRAMIA